MTTSPSSLTHGGLFSGIGGFSEGFRRAGIRTVWDVEIDPACRRVLRHHDPDVALYEDVREVGAHNLEPVDIITFGFPCQDLSVAGKRAGLDGGDRSILFWEALRVIKELRPTFAVAENVPGLLSSHGGRDMAAVLWGLWNVGAHDIGWRTLDAQYFGVAQRRRRVFVVADFRGERAGEILALADGLSGHPAPRRETGARLATDVAASLRSRGENTGTRIGAETGLVAYRMQAFGEYADDNSASSLKQRDYKDATDLVVTHTLSAEGHDASEDGTGRGTPLVAFSHDVAPALTSNYGKQPDNSDTSTGPNLIAFQQNQRDEVRDLGDVAGALPAQPGMKQQNYIAVRTANTSANGHGVADDVAHTIDGANGQAIAFACKDHGADAGSGTPIIPITFDDQRGRDNGGFGFDQARTIHAAKGQSEVQLVAAPTTAVRRLTPTECERLMGLPDGWTDVAGHADSTRYRQLGNSVVVNVTYWLGQRIRQSLEEAEHASS